MGFHQCFALCLHPVGSLSLYVCVPWLTLTVCLRYAINEHNSSWWKPEHVSRAENGAERAENRLSGSRTFQKTLEQERSGAGGRGAGAGAGAG